MSSKFLIGNMLSALSNTRVLRNNLTVIEYSNLCLSVLSVMQSAGYIESFSVINLNNLPKISVVLRVIDGKKVMQKVSLKSVPGCRVYCDVKEIRSLLDRNKYKTYIFSTPLGVRDAMSALKDRVGGEFLCEVY